MKYQDIEICRFISFLLPLIVILLALTRGMNLLVTKKDKKYFFDIL